MESLPVRDHGHPAPAHGIDAEPEEVGAEEDGDDLRGEDRPVRYLDDWEYGQDAVEHRDGKAGDGGHPEPERWREAEPPRRHDRNGEERQIRERVQDPRGIVEQLKRL